MPSKRKPDAAIRPRPIPRAQRNAIDAARADADRARAELEDLRERERHAIADDLAREVEHVDSLFDTLRMVDQLVGLVVELRAAARVVRP